MKFTTDEVKALVIATMPGPMKDAAEEAFIDWLDQIVETVTANASQSRQGYDEGYADGWDAALDYVDSAEYF